MPDARYCPNCDRKLPTCYAMVIGEWTTCQSCGITWEGAANVAKLPTYPIGDEERESAFHRAKWRARLAP